MWGSFALHTCIQRDIYVQSVNVKTLNFNDVVKSEQSAPECKVSNQVKHKCYLETTRSSTL